MRAGIRPLPRRWGGAPVHCAALPDAPDAVDREPRPGVPRGTVSEHEVPSGQPGADRRVGGLTATYGAYSAVWLLRRSEIAGRRSGQSASIRR
ncbi:hypothetical protein OG301_04775 [Streptomyces platensis]|uniref:hypothetical protein n=1 Tax=Streptomyces platensis TaxID=58346 RepID=UPI002ED1EE98|nr:hypothetical protein OG301_04775 [Streptomyces platensis]